jgi:hypothetical protein
VYSNLGPLLFCFFKISIIRINTCSRNSNAITTTINIVMSIEQNKEKKRVPLFIFLLVKFIKFEDDDTVMRETVYFLFFFFTTYIDDNEIVDTCQKAQNLLFFNHTFSSNNVTNFLLDAHLSRRNSKKFNICILFS